MNRILGPFCAIALRQPVKLFGLAASFCVIANLSAGCGGSGHAMSSAPILSVSSMAAAFSAVQGSSSNPSPASIEVTNTTTGTLNFTAASDAGWLAVAPASGTAPQTLQLSAAVGTMAPNTYTGHGNNPVCGSTSPGPYFITQLDANLNIEWQFQSTTIDARHPNRYEWCINMPAIDILGNVYVNSEDGNIYKLSQGNTGVFTMPTGKMFLDIALGAAYTPLSIGSSGKTLHPE